MKLGTKSNLISAYSALFTVAFGMLIYDHVRRSSATQERPVVQSKASQAAESDRPQLASR